MASGYATTRDPEWREGNQLTRDTAGATRQIVAPPPPGFTRSVFDLFLWIPELVPPNKSSRYTISIRSSGTDYMIHRAGLLEDRATERFEGVRRMLLKEGEEMVIEWDMALFLEEWTAVAAFADQKAKPNFVEDIEKIRVAGGAGPYELVSSPPPGHKKILRYITGISETGLVTRTAEISFVRGGTSTHVIRDPLGLQNPGDNVQLICGLILLPGDTIEVDMPLSLPIETYTWTANFDIVRL